MSSRKKQLVIRKVKPGKLELFKQWAQELQDKRYAEAQATLSQENVCIEFAYAAEIAGEWYAILYVESCDEQGIQPTDMQLPINQKHRAVLYECLEFGSEGVLLYDIRNERVKNEQTNQQ